MTYITASTGGLLNNGIGLVTQSLVYMLFNMILEGLMEIMDTVYYILRAILVFQPMDYLALLGEDVNNFYNTIFLPGSFALLFGLLIFSILLGEYLTNLDFCIHELEYLCPL